MMQAPRRATKGGKRNSGKSLFDSSRRNSGLRANDRCRIVLGLNIESHEGVERFEEEHPLEVPNGQFSPATLRLEAYTLQCAFTKKQPRVRMNMRWLQQHRTDS